MSHQEEQVAAGPGEAMTERPYAGAGANGIANIIFRKELTAGEDPGQRSKELADSRVRLTPLGASVDVRALTEGVSTGYYEAAGTGRDAPAPAPDR
jgi:hypothetical protein